MLSPRYDESISVLWRLRISSRKVTDPFKERDGFDSALPPVDSLILVSQAIARVRALSPTNPHRRIISIANIQC